VSNSALDWAFSLKLKPSSAKFVLLAMADRVGEALRFFQSISTLIERTGLDRKTVINAVKVLQELGIITDTGDRVGRTKSITVYKLNVPSSPQNGTAKQSQNRDNSTPKAVPFFPASSPAFPSKQSQKRDTDPNRTQSTPKKRRMRNDAHPLFELWYAAYPLKKSRAAASKAFSKLNPDESLVHAMIEAIDRQIGEREAKRRRDVFVPQWKHPATWLNGECWLDEPDAGHGNLPPESNYWEGGI